MLLVFGLDAGAAAEQVGEAAGLQTDHVEVLLVVESAFVALQVADCLEPWLHDIAVL